MKPRILFVVQLPPPLHGVTVMNDRVVKSDLLASQFDIDVLPLRFSESVDQIRRPSVGKLLRAFTTGMRLSWSLVADRPDAVYFTMAPTGLGFYRDATYSVVMKLLRVPRIVHLHARGIGSLASGAWARHLHRWLFRGAFVIHLSPRLLEETAAFVDQERVIFVPNGIDDVPGAGLRTAHAGPPRILFLSNMIREKGPLDLLEALRRLRDRGIEFQATFAGARFHDGCVEQFEETVQREGLAGCLRYVGAVYGDDKLSLLRGHDIFAFPSYFEAFGLVLLEAMQHGLPVVASDEGAIGDIVADGETGFLVPKRDVDCLADRLETLLLNPKLRGQLGAAGRRRYLEHFTGRQFEQALVSALARCIDEFA